MKTPTLYLRRATLADLDTLTCWRRETARWLAKDKGTDQWGVDYPREKLIAWIEAGETVMASPAPGGDPVATITVSLTGDPGLWTPEELQTPACYLFKANVERSHANLGIGKALIVWGMDRAAQAGIEIVRIDVWSTNLALQEYYKHMGFQHLRTVPNVNSGALLVASTRRTPCLSIVELDDELPPRPVPVMK